MALNYARLLFSPRGRLRRRLYWRGTLVLLAASMAPLLIPRAGPSIAGAVGVVALYGFACLYIKRLHDLGRSGWWQLAGWGLVLGPLILSPILLGALAGTQLASRLEIDTDKVIQAFMALSTIVTALVLGFHLLLGVLRGDAGANRFGPDPGKPFDPEVFD